MYIKLFIFSLLLAIPSYSNAQSRQISVKVVDSANSEPVADVLVFMENSNCDARTDSNGQCVLSPKCLKSKTICFIVRASFVRKKFCLSTSSDYNATFIIPISREKEREVEKLLPAE